MRNLAAAALACCVVFAAVSCGDPAGQAPAVTAEPRAPAPRRASVADAPSPATAEPRAAIAGTVTASGRAARARVEVRRLCDAGEDSWRARQRAIVEGRLTDDPLARCDAEGAFEFAGLDPGVYRIAASGESGLSGFVEAEVVAAGERVIADVRLFRPPGDCALRGRVRGLPDGAARAFIVATYDQRAASRAPEFVALDAEGRFTLAGLAEGPVRPVVLVPGRLRIRTPAVRVAGETETEIDLAKLLRRFTVRVVAADGGAAIAGVRVTCEDEEEDDVWTLPATTREDGTAVFLAPAQTLTGTATATGFPRSTWEAQAEDETALVRLRRCADVSVRVVARDGGAPVPGAAVRWAAERASQDERALARTDETGVARLGPIAPGAVQFFVRDPQWSSVGEARWAGDDRDREDPFGRSRPALPLRDGVFLVPDSGEACFTLQVRPAHTVTGRVLDENGERVRGARVRVHERRDALWADGEPTPWSCTATGPDGTFVLRGVAPQAEALTARDGRHVATTVPIPAQGEPVEIRLQACDVRRVIVREKDGGPPVPGAVVRCRAAASGGLDRATTDEEGIALLGPLPSGPWTLEVETRDALDAAPVVLESRALGASEPFVLEIDRGLEIHGRVLRPDGTPLAAYGEHVMVGKAGSGSKTGEPIGPDGAFRVRGLLPGEYEIEVELDEEGRHLKGVAVATAGGPAVELTTWSEDDSAASGRRANLTIRVTDADGVPVPSGRYFFTSERSGTGSSFAAGRIEIDGGWLGEGDRATLEVHSLVDASKIPCGLGAAIVALPDPLPERFEVRLGPENPIRGVVRDGDGRGVAGTRVRACPRTEPSDDWGGADFLVDHGAHGEAVSAADGGFTIRGLGDLDYTLVTQAPAEFLQPEKRTAHGGATGVEIVLVAGVRPRVTVLAPDGSAVAGARVSADAADDPWGQRGADARTDRDGVASLRALSSNGRFSLRVDPPEGSDLLPHAAESWPVAAETTVRLEQGLTITGVVIGPDGAPLPRFRVAYTSTDGRGRSESTDDAGRFRLGPMRAGEVTVTLGDAGMRRGRGWAVTESGPASRTGSIRLAAGTEDARLELPQGSFLVVRCEGVAASDVDLDETRLFSADGKTQRSPMVLSGGRLLFTGLVPESEYAFFSRIGAKARVALHRGWRPGIGETARFGEGAVLTGRVILPSGAALRDVDVRAEIGGVRIATKAAADGSFRIPALPPVELDVRVFASDEDGGSFGFFKATPGGEPVTLKPTQQSIPADGR